MKILELYSGIGGMHLALQKSGIPGHVALSIDINQTANLVYKHNFPNTLLLNRNIQSLTSKYINELDIDTILMSPPCQPFTRSGLKGDIKDVRTQSFVHILNLLPELNVKNILIENVKGFECSQMRDLVIKGLTQSKFIFQEFILTPTEFGVSNTRHRYYCIAKKLPAEFSFEPGTLLESLPQEQRCLQHFKPQPLAEILDDSAKTTNYRITDELLKKHATTLDICHYESIRSCCFTKAYGRYVTGTGSVLTDKTKKELDFVYAELKNYPRESHNYLQCIKQLNLRFFTPHEVCRLMCFPESFNFPENITDRQKYMLLGNSVNIKVVSEVIKMLYN